MSDETDEILAAADALAVALGRAKATDTYPSLRGFSFDEMTAIHAFWNTARADAAQTLRDSIAELDPDDHLATMYMIHHVERLPDLIDPAKCSKCRAAEHEGDDDCGA